MTETVFTPEQHAVMFGLLARGVCQQFENRADRLLWQAVESYGMERGARMAQRCLQMGHALDMISYDAYGELPAFSGSERTQPDAQCAHLRYRMVRCPWCDAWRRHGLTVYGPYYCRCVDAAILRGFNPRLTLRLPTWLSDPASDGCRFEWLDAPNEPARDARVQKLRRLLDGRQTRSFDWHTAHLLSAVMRCLRAASPEKAQLVYEQARTGFARIFGPQAWQQVERWLDTDFSAI